MSSTTVKATPLSSIFKPLLAPALIVVSLAFWWASRPLPEPPPMLDQALMRLTGNTEFHTLDETPEPLPWEHYTIARGDVLANLWNDQWQLPRETLYHLLANAEKGQMLARLRPGQHLEWQADSEGRLLNLRVWLNEGEGYQWHLDGDAISGGPLNLSRTLHEVQIAGRIDTSLAAALAGDPSLGGSADSIARQVAELLPLTKKARRGDRFSVMVQVERLGDHAEAYSAKLMGFDYEGAKIQVAAARFDDDRFYTPSGESLLPSFWRYPFEQRYRISSNFNPRRLHPITGRVSPHLGTDFAMPVGSPVEAPADGVVKQVVHHALAGNYVVIDHGDGYQTRYLHLSRIKVRPGDTVHQGQVLAYSGNTGRSTGPHLHYELRMNGRPVNAMAVSLPTKGKLQSDELKRFQSRYAGYFKLDRDDQQAGTAVAQQGGARKGGV
ncbi:peptidase M23 (plasmid) [Alcanivorax sp. N3-2A]|nr:peptidase M23 [Alcanivorax sp. N3-2A]ASK36728.1 peptidase M23 [Alcanivorax sp. N3-2A]